MFSFYFHVSIDWSIDGKRLRQAENRDDEDLGARTTWYTRAAALRGDCLARSNGEQFCKTTDDVITTLVINSSNNNGPSSRWVKPVFSVAQRESIFVVGVVITSWNDSFACGFKELSILKRTSFAILQNDPPLRFFSNSAYKSIVSDGKRLTSWIYREQSFYSMESTRGTWRSGWCIALNGLNNWEINT